MSILSDRDITKELEAGRLVLSGGALQPASVDLTLGEDLLSYPLHMRLSEAIDPEDPPRMEKRSWYRALGERSTYRLPADGFLLGHVAERVQLGRGLVGRLDGKSTLARLGLMVHLTAGYVDPGWDGRLTLELKNLSPFPILLRRGMPIAQLVLYRTSSPVAVAYGDERAGSHYQGSPSVAQAASLRVTAIV